MDKFMCKFECSLWKKQQDREGEVKIILLVPSKYAEEAMRIPPLKPLAVGITEFTPNE